MLLFFFTHPFLEHDVPKNVDSAAAVLRGSGLEGLALYYLGLFISTFMYLERKTVQCRHFPLKTVITSCPRARQD
jgi:hypothetical protein